MIALIDVKPDAKTVARSTPSASSTVTTSSAQQFGVILSAPMRDDMPIPRWSNRMTRQNDESRRKNRYIEGSESIESMGMNGPGITTTSHGPSPSDWYAMSRSPLDA
jgi:hypothetical protein